MAGMKLSPIGFRHDLLRPSLSNFSMIRFYYSITVVTAESAYFAHEFNIFCGSTSTGNCFAMQIVIGRNG
jgi:hypothetical protein